MSSSFFPAALFFLSATLSFASASDWRTLPLLRDHELSPDWQHVGFGRMVVEGDTVRTDPDARGLGLLVYTKERFGDCQIRIVYRTADAKDNAGVHIRMDEGILKWIGREATGVTRRPDGSLTEEMAKKMAGASEREEGGWYAVHHGFEVQIMDSGDAFHRSGSIYSFAPADALPDTAPGKWRTMIITLRDTEVLVELDGKAISRFDSASREIPPRKTWSAPKREHTRPTHGYIGLQIHDPGDLVYFKEVAVRPL